MHQRSTLLPKNTADLCLLVAREIQAHGPQCDLNHIDVSQLFSLDGCFQNTAFTGDISKWDVSNVDNMISMFKNSAFNGDISRWDTSRLAYASIEMDFNA